MSNEELAMGKTLGLRGVTASYAERLAPRMASLSGWEKKKSVRVPPTPLGPAQVREVAASVRRVPGLEEGVELKREKGGFDAGLAATGPSLEEVQAVHANPAQVRAVLAVSLPVGVSARAKASRPVFFWVFEMEVLVKNAPKNKKKTQNNFGRSGNGRG